MANDKTTMLKLKQMLQPQSPVPKPDVRKEAFDKELSNYLKMKQTLCERPAPVEGVPQGISRRISIHSVQKTPNGYINMNKFIERIALSKMEGSVLKVISHLEKNDLIILDDVDLQPLDANSGLALLQIPEERYERKSTMIISQPPVSMWYDYIAEPTLSDAIMDRLVSNAVHQDLKGESMRRRGEETSNKISL